jgi:class 3 adenylate cyclase
VLFGFDEICERHGLEKIKTIGDAYMCAGGLPLPNETHAADAVRAALEMPPGSKPANTSVPMHTSPKCVSVSIPAR